MVHDMDGTFRMVCRCTEPGAPRICVERMVVFPTFSSWNCRAGRSSFPLCRNAGVLFIGRGLHSGLLPGPSACDPRSTLLYGSFTSVLTGAIRPQTVRPNPTENRISKHSLRSPVSIYRSLIVISCHRTPVHGVPSLGQSLEVKELRE
jgi:hypothetical protein